MRFLTLLLAFFTLSCGAQWELQRSPTAASLRGVDRVGRGVVWASGAEGTVLRTLDDGAHWQRCSRPTGAEKLDFRGVRGFDAKTAIVMSSGPGELSRLYRTRDGCASWKLLFTNPDREGFWDALQAETPDHLVLLGDPVGGAFRVFESTDGGVSWVTQKLEPAVKGEGAFAASNSNLFVDWQEGLEFFGTGSPQGARLFSRRGRSRKGGRVEPGWSAEALPMFAKGAAAGIFSIEGYGKHLVAVGGDYTKPDDAAGTAAFSTDGGARWEAAGTLPHGYRSAVAYDRAARRWIAVGPNGTDVSTDDGRNWRPMAARLGGQTLDADGDWNALSLPFVVGSHGRIGRRTSTP